MAFRNFFYGDFNSNFIEKYPTCIPENARCVAVITSGGDSPGMNPAVRGVVRGALNQGCRVFAVRDGYLGLCRGNDDDIVPIGWVDVAGITQIGGTFLGTARCAEFRSQAGRRQVTFNLISRGINNLIIIGGDGSLTGASILGKEWPEFVESILSELTDEQKEDPNFWYKKYWSGREDTIKTLQVVGLVGSIDNDMGNTSMTIGCDSALNRICTAVDILSSTAASHQRVFIVEVMGRKCGWLALKAAVACGADWVFIPENPSPKNWKDELIHELSRTKQPEKRCSLIIIAEGAQDVDMKPISASDVCNALTEAGSDTRVTILGHVQRGGPPSFYDRASSILLGYAAVNALVLGKATEEPQVVCVNGIYDYTTHPLSACLETSSKITASINNKDFIEAMRLRGSGFLRAHHVCEALVRSDSEGKATDKHNIGLLHIGACAPGMNAIVRAFVRLGLDKELTSYGIQNGLVGLQDGSMHKMSWMDVYGWSSLGGANLGTSRFDPKNMNLKKISKQLKKFQIKTLVMIGGWDGYICMKHLKSENSTYPYLAELNVLLVPCTISNNLPFTKYSIGVDSALNSIIDSVDKIKESAIAQRRVYVIEVMGAHCGFLCALGAFASGAEKAFCPEDSITLQSLDEDFKDIQESFANSKTMALIFTTEKTSRVFDAKFLAKYFRSQSHGQYDVRLSILGHIQQGGSPSPLDRFLGAEMVGECIKSICENHEQKKVGVFKVVGIDGGDVIFSDASQMDAAMDLAHRRPKNHWWKEKLSQIFDQYAEWKEHPEKYSRCSQEKQDN